MKSRNILITFVISMFLFGCGKSGASLTFRTWSGTKQLGVATFSTKGTGHRRWS